MNLISISNDTLWYILQWCDDREFRCVKNTCKRINAKCKKLNLYKIYELQKIFLQSIEGSVINLYKDCCRSVKPLIFDYNTKNYKVAVVSDIIKKINLPLDSYINLVHVNIQTKDIHQLNRVDNCYHSKLGTGHTFYFNLSQFIRIEFIGQIYDDFQFIRKNGNQTCININYARVMLNNTIDIFIPRMTLLDNIESHIKGFIGTIIFHEIDHDIYYENKIGYITYVNNYGLDKFNPITTNWILIKASCKCGKSIQEIKDVSFNIRYKIFRKEVEYIPNYGNATTYTPVYINTVIKFADKNIFDRMWREHTNTKRPIDTVIINIRDFPTILNLANMRIIINDGWQAYLEKINSRGYINDACNNDNHIFKSHLYYNNINLVCPGGGTYPYVIE